MMRYIIANWKMNLNLADITQWFKDFGRELPKIPTNTQIIIAASAPYLGMLSVLTKIERLSLSAQDISVLDRGAHTGDIGAFQVKDFCSYAIVGHSERNEAIETSIKKRDICLANGVTPIFCFSNIADIEEAITLDRQPTEPSAQPTALSATPLILSWEDPATISSGGTYRDKPKEDIRSGIDGIRSKIPADTILIYGGSVNRQNITDLASIAGLNGVLVGNASIDAAHFAELVLKFSDT